MPSAGVLFSELTDEALIERVSELACRERRATAQLIAALAEFDRRRLYLPLGCSSLFTYCTQILHLSEHAAYNRIEAARAVMRFPTLLHCLEDGSITLTAVRLLAPCLTTENLEQSIDAARHKNKREIELLVAGLRPQTDVPSVARKLPQRRSPASLTEKPALATASATPENHDAGATSAPNAIGGATSSAPPSVISPLTPERYKIQFTASRTFHLQLQRARALLRHTVPSGDLAEILGRALNLLLADIEKRKIGAAERPRMASPTRPESRHIPAAVKREVWKRDAGRCAFVGTAGRCAEEAFLEFHHVVPFAEGGPATTANIELRCRAHNIYESGEFFGRLFNDE